MAKRESHALEVSLITFVLLTAVSLMVALGVWVKLKRVVADSEALAQGKTQAENSLRTTEQEVQQLRTMLGYDPRTPMTAIQDNFTKDQASFGKGLDEAQKNYRGILNDRHRKVLEQGQEILKSEQQNRELIAQVQAIREAELKTKEELKKSSDGLQAQLDKAMADFAAQKKKDDERAEALFAEVTKLKSEVALAKTEKETQVTALESQLATNRRQYENTKKMLDETNSSAFEVPDGRITWVDQRSRTVWINIGRADGLRRNLAFNVYARDENNLNTAIKKGRIEVTNVRNGHTAEGKIIEDSNRNPILADDLIATPLWNPGSSLRYALAGKMDINGDGRDDRELVKSLIEQVGGRVDAETKKAGIEGEVTIHTRYLVLGERPTDASNADEVKAYTEMIAAAKRFNVESMSVDKLVDAMGLGSRIRGSAQNLSSASKSASSAAASESAGGGAAAAAGGGDADAGAADDMGGAAAADEDAAAGDEPLEDDGFGADALGDEPADDAGAAEEGDAAADDEVFGDSADAGAAQGRTRR